MIIKYIMIISSREMLFIIVVVKVLLVELGGLL